MDILVTSLGTVISEDVRIWRPVDDSRVLAMAGRTVGYAVDPRDEYVLGVIADQVMHARRGRERRLARPGQILAWDPSGAHSGSAVEGRPWFARLIVVGSADLAALVGDRPASLPSDISFPEPIVSDPALACAFLRLHADLELPTTRLERDEQLAQWLQQLVARWSSTRPPAPRTDARDDRALRLACDFLGDHAERNVSLDELSAVTGVDKFRLLRLFHDRIGLPPHALQTAHRVRRARRLLEAGESITATATATGFFDQSHLHREFRRSLGVTPGEYQRHLTRR